MEQNTTQLFRWAKELQNMAAAGIQYTTNDFDRERFLRIRDIAAEMAAYELDLPPAQLKDAFALDLGYQTPKIETRAAIFDEDRVLLVRERNGKWSMPGGWCDVDQSIASNTEKEVREETGFTVRAERLIAVHDWRKRNVKEHVYGVMKMFVLCRYESGEFEENIETTGIGLFGRDELPEGLAAEKNTREQIEMCFGALDDPRAPTQFD